MSTPSEVDPFLEGQFSPLDGHAPAFDVQPDPCFDWLLEWNVGSSPVSPCATDATTALGAKNAAPEVVAPQPAAAGKKRLRENSLGSEDSCSDAVSVEQAATKKGKSDATAAAGAATGESKELDRKEKNRRSAAASRLRKKAAMETMLLRCKELESANASLSYYLGLANAEIQNLRRDLASLNTSASRGQPAEQYLDFPPLESPRQSPPKDLQDLSSVPLPCQRSGTEKSPSLAFPPPYNSSSSQICYNISELLLARVRAFPLVFSQSLVTLATSSVERDSLCVCSLSLSFSVLPQVSSRAQESSLKREGQIF